MAHPLHGYRLKLNRASGHLEKLKAEIQPWLDQHPYGIVGKYEPGPPEQYVFRFRVFDPPPDHWSLLIGEFAHQARSALDHLVWALVGLNDNTPTIRNQFPILHQREDWKGRHGVSRLHGVADQHIAWIENLQPYNRTTEPNARFAARLAMDDPLSLLSSLNNEDKHRVLVPAFGAMRSIGFDVVETRDIAPLNDIGNAVFERLEDGGAPLLQVPVVSTGPNPYVQMEINERIEVTVEQRIELPDGTRLSREVMNVTDALDDIVSRLRYVFQIFVPEFG